MTSQVFYRKWRPQTLSEVVGQQPVTQTLQNALNSGRISHAYLFYGPRGTGKTSTARILAKAVNCLSQDDIKPCNNCAICRTISENRSLDIIEIDAASNTGVEDMRSLREKVGYSPNEARYKVYIIDEVHMLSNSASNALLKTLEEPPPHVIFILATTEAHKILPTIMSRCQRFDFRRISQTDIIDKLSQVAGAEDIKITPEALRLVARSATGSLRDAENLLEQLATYYGSEISLEQVQATLGIIGDWRARELVKHIIGNDLAAGMTTINSINNDGLDLRQFNRELVEYLRALLLIKTGSVAAVDLTGEDIAELKGLAAGATLEQVLRATRLFGQLELGFDSYATLPLELALVDCTQTIEKEPVKEAENPRTTTGKSPQPSRTTAPPPAPVQPKAATPPQPGPAETKPERHVIPEPIEPGTEPAARVARPAKPVKAQSDTPDTPVPAGVMPLEGGSAIERLQQNWKSVIDQAPQDTRKSSAIAILRSAGVKPVAVENGTVSLSFRYTNHKELIEKVENQQIVEKIISNFLGYPCRVHCVMENNHLIKAALKMGAQITGKEEE